MYADRYGQRHGLKPGSVMLALGMTALPIAGLVLSAQVRSIIATSPVFKTINIEAPKPPPPPETAPEPQTEVKAPPKEMVFTPRLPIDLPPPQNPIDTTDIRPQLQPQPPMIAGAGAGGAVATPTPPPSIFTNAGIDPRYAGVFQPPYPASEIRAGAEGRVVLRVLIGTDGRVKQVEKVSATNQAFFAAAERQALGKWRFKPATKDGVPIEQWKEMSLRFELNGQDQ